MPGCARHVGWGCAWRVRVCEPRLHQPRQRVHVAGHRRPPLREAQIRRLDLAWRVKRAPTREEPCRAAQSGPEPGALPRPPFGHAASPSWIERRTSRRGSSPFAAVCSALRPGVSRLRRPCFVELLSSIVCASERSVRGTAGASTVGDLLQRSPSCKTLPRPRGGRGGERGQYARGAHVCNIQHAILHILYAYIVCNMQSSLTRFSASWAQ